MRHPQVYQKEASRAPKYQPEISSFCHTFTRMPRPRYSPMPVYIEASPMRAAGASHLGPVQRDGEAQDTSRGAVVVATTESTLRPALLNTFLASREHGANVGACVVRDGARGTEMAGLRKITSDRTHRLPLHHPQTRRTAFCAAQGLHAASSLHRSLSRYRTGLSQRYCTAALNRALLKEMCLGNVISVIEFARGMVKNVEVKISDENI